MRNIKNHLLDFKLLYIFLLIVLLLIGWWLWYEYTYPCVYGHYEQVWQSTYCYGAHGLMYPCGGYYAETFICDCRTVRDTLN